MAVIAREQITLAAAVDVASVWWYYLVQSATLSPPAKPTTNPPGGSWTLYEPAYDGTATNALYVAELTVFSDGSFAWSDVSLSSSYEAAKAAWNKADGAEAAAGAAQDVAGQAQAAAGEAQDAAEEAKDAADRAQATADSAEATAAKVRAVFYFTADGLRTRFGDSKWSTLVSEDGFYIDHDDVAGHVGAFHEEAFEPRTVTLGGIVCRATSSGGWSWTAD